MAPTAANVEEYINLTVEQARLRQLRGLGPPIASAPTLEDARKLLAQANRIVGACHGVQVVNMEQGLLDFYDRQRKPANLMPWGLEKVDGTLRCEYGDFVVLGGYPSAGKTALSLQLAWTCLLYTSLTIQERLKDLRVERGLTLEQLAEQTHLSKSALGSYEAEDFKAVSYTHLVKGVAQAARRAVHPL